MVRLTKVAGVNKLRQQLKSLQAKSRKDNDVTVLVGYTAEYAMHVHENVEVPHTNGQSKYLEFALRDNAREILNVIRKVSKATGSLLKGLLMGGQLLQRESQKLVPVDTGNLKGSAFTKKE